MKDVLNWWEGDERSLQPGLRQEGREQERVEERKKKREGVGERKEEREKECTES